VSFDIVVAADLAWGIGKRNGLPWPKLRADLQHFKRVTSEGGRNAVIMGRNTWESTEVAGRPLPRRINVVVTRRPLEVPEGVIVVSSLDAALAVAADATFVVGGAALLRDAFGHAALRFVYLTRIAGRFDCDVVIPDLDALGFVKSAWPGELAVDDEPVRYRIERLAPPPR
jgi:dihydrofolate reductase